MDHAAGGPAGDAQFPAAGRRHGEPQPAPAAELGPRARARRCAARRLAARPRPARRAAKPRCARSGFLRRHVLSGRWRRAAGGPRLVLAGSGLAAPMAWLAARTVGARCRGLPARPGRHRAEPRLPVAVAALHPSLRPGAGQQPPTRRASPASRGVAGRAYRSAASGHRLPDAAPGPRRRVPPSARLGLTPAAALGRPAHPAQGPGRIHRRSAAGDRGRMPDTAPGDRRRGSVDALHGARGSERERIGRGRARRAGLEAQVRFLGRCEEERARTRPSRPRSCTCSRCSGRSATSRASAWWRWNRPHMACHRRLRCRWRADAVDAQRSGSVVPRR